MFLIISCHVLGQEVRLLGEVKEKWDREEEEERELVEEEDMDDDEYEWCLEESW